MFICSTVVANGLTITAAGFHIEPQAKSFKRGGFDSKMPKQEAPLIAGVSSPANKGKIRATLLQITLLNKGASPYIAAKINKAKDLLQG
ncbi:unnamed protein product [Nyctereutes procyonoides]|uniref:(raccoon dog) hypothetical protein n=1 Tax=Nyctereutes procyonoides TaxID=34880 RepID=A0A811Y4I1_NYCPR|nr:unnamed protein product [Nyctereutes procyonoides]